MQLPHRLQPPATTPNRTPQTPQDYAAGSDRLLFFAVTGTSRLAGLSPASAPDAAPSLCLVTRGRNYTVPFAEAEAAAGEMAQPGSGRDGALDAGRLDRAYSVG